MTTTAVSPSKRSRNGAAAAPDWTPEQVEALRRMRAEGRSIIFCTRELQNAGFDVSGYFVLTKAKELGINQPLNFGQMSGSRVRQMFQAAKSTPI